MLSENFFFVLFYSKILSSTTVVLDPSTPTLLTPYFYSGYKVEKGSNLEMFIIKNYGCKKVSLNLYKQNFLTPLVTSLIFILNLEGWSAFFPLSVKLARSFSFPLLLSFILPFFLTVYFSY